MENLNLQKISGIAAILTGLVAIVGVVLFGSTDVIDADNGAEMLAAIDADKNVIAPGVWLLTLAPLLLLGALAGIYQKLRGAGDIMRIALIALTVDALFIVLSNILVLGVAYEIATPWVEAGSDAGSDLVVVGDALLTMSIIARVVGDAVGLGIGILLFSLAILKTGLAPKWIGWIGLLAAVGGWLGLFVSASDVFGAFGLIGAVAMFVWMISLGATMVRSEA